MVVNQLSGLWVPTVDAAAPAVIPHGGQGAAGAGQGPAVLGLGPAWVRFTGRAEGGMADVSASHLGRDGTDLLDVALRARRRAVVDRPWTVLRQVHGADVVVVDEPGAASGRPADAAVSACRGVALAVLTADCAPVAFASPEGVIGVAHAGWRGLVSGVISETVLAMRELGARSILAALGPCIGAECYAFGPSDLDGAAACFGDGVRAETRTGEPALDVAAAVRVAVEQAGAELVWEAAICTSCSADHWSWRARRDTQRQATVVWRW